MSSGASTARPSGGQSSRIAACALVPAYQAEASVGRVVTELRQGLNVPVVAVDDGSTDGTAEVARRAGAHVVAHAKNRGKGAALETGLVEARELGFEVALAVDADGQHPVESARAVLDASPDPRVLVLGVRDLLKDGAPRANRMSNGISNFFLSRFTGRPLSDTQCGLRRYPVAATLALGARAAGYAYEAEILIRAIRAGMSVVEQPIRVIYPPEELRVTHFDSVKDPARIIVTVLATLWDLRQHQ